MGPRLLREHRRAERGDDEEFHWNVSKDKRRRNALAALGWTIFPIDKYVLDFRAVAGSFEWFARFRTVVDIPPIYGEKSAK